MNRTIVSSIIGVALFATVSQAEQIEVYQIDPAHSAVQFKIRHFFAKVPGGFTDFDGKIILNRTDIAKSKVEATIKTASIDTANEKRDGHLRSADFFDAEKYPTITFKSTAWKEVGKNAYEVTGDFTMHGVTKPVTLAVKDLGSGAAMGGHRGGWEATTTIDRTVYGVAWNKAVEGGGMTLGNEVEITLNIEGVQEASVASQ
jgi:polyisoprenoid-binding protein YceI